MYHNKGVYQKPGHNVIHVFYKKGDLTGRLAMFAGFPGLFHRKFQTFSIDIIGKVLRD